MNRKEIKAVFEEKEINQNWPAEMDPKLRVAYIAARIANEFHQGQVDKAGKDYFEGHLCFVGNSGSDWKEKTVGFLHDVAEDTPHTTSEVVSLLKKGLKEWEQDGCEDMNLCVPTDEEWNEIEEALNLLNSHTAPDRDAYIERFRGHWVAMKVKMNDLNNNMDIGRISNPTPKDFARVERYKSERCRLAQMLLEIILKDA